MSTHDTPGARAEFVLGIRAFVPLVMANVPFGMICGAAAIAAGLTPWQAFAMSWVIFAGSVQIAASQLLASGAPLAVIVATAAVINLRFMMYSASVAPYLGRLGKRWQIVLAYLVTDQAFALGILHYMRPGERRHRHWYLFGLSAATWLCWQTATIAGILVGQLIPADWSMDFILPLTFIAIVVPLFSNRAMLVPGLAGGAAAVLLVLPLKLNLIAAALIGIGAGVLADRKGSAR